MKEAWDEMPDPDPMGNDILKMQAEEAGEDWLTCTNILNLDGIGYACQLPETHLGPHAAKVQGYVLAWWGEAEHAKRVRELNV